MWEKWQATKSKMKKKWKKNPRSHRGEWNEDHYFSDFYPNQNSAKCFGFSLLNYLSIVTWFPPERKMGNLLIRVRRFLFSVSKFPHVLMNNWLKWRFFLAGQRIFFIRNEIENVLNIEQYSMNTKWRDIHFVCNLVLLFRFFFYGNHFYRTSHQNHKGSRKEEKTDQIQSLCNRVNNLFSIFFSKIF